jgi:hypothetical protein
MLAAVSLAREGADPFGPLLLSSTEEALMNTVRRLLLLAPLALGSLEIARSYGQNLAVTRQEQSQGPVTYLSGGVGEEEAQVMRAAAADYPLTLELATAGQPRDPYIANAQVEIRDQRGQPVLNTTTDGPFLLVRLPSGKYTVDVQWNGAQQQRSVQVSGEKRQHVFVEFPRSADR